MVTDKCIGVANKDEIRDLQEEVRTLRLKMKHLEDNSVNHKSLSMLKVEISELRHTLIELTNNRIEDRRSIEIMNESMSNISTRLEEYMEAQSSVVAQQEITSQSIEMHQKLTNMSIDNINDAIIELVKKVDDNSFWKQIEKFKTKSPINKWVYRLSIAVIIMSLTSMATFYMGGGITIVDIIELLKGVV